MRRATIVVRWDGPDKAVRDFIEDKIDALFYDLSMAMGEKITFADAAVQFESRIKDGQSHAKGEAVTTERNDDVAP
jgi:hypothetical protein